MTPSSRWSGTRDDVTSGRLQWTELTPPESQAVSERAVAQLRASGTCEIFEKEYFRSDGSRVPVLVAATVIGDARSETLAFVLDLTERKRAEEERERLRQERSGTRRAPPTSSTESVPFTGEVPHNESWLT